MLKNKKYYLNILKNKINKYSLRNNIIASIFTHAP